jgi:hypothetical protein
MKQNFSKNCSHSAYQEIQLLWSLKFHYSVQNEAVIGPYFVSREYNAHIHIFTC